MSTQQLAVNYRFRWNLAVFRLGLLAVVLATVSTPSIAQNPTTPAKLAVEFIDKGVELSWSPSSDDTGVAGYNVYRNKQYLTTIFQTQYVLTEQNALGQDFFVVAYDAPQEGEIRSYSAPSATITVPQMRPKLAPVDTSPPTAPTALSARRTGDLSVELMWSGAEGDAGITGYEVYRDDQYLKTITDTTFVDSLPNAGFTHSYYVVAFDELQNFSSHSPRISIGTQVGTITIIGLTSEPDQLPDNKSDLPNNKIDQKIKPEIGVSTPVPVKGLTIDTGDRVSIRIIWKRQSKDKPT